MSDLRDFVYSPDPARKTGPGGWFPRTGMHQKKTVDPAVRFQTAGNRLVKPLPGQKHEILEGGLAVTEHDIHESVVELAVIESGNAPDIGRRLFSGDRKKAAVLQGHLDIPAFRRIQLKSTR